MSVTSAAAGEAHHVEFRVVGLEGYKGGLLRWIRGYRSEGHVDAGGSVGKV